MVSLLYKKRGLVPRKFTILNKRCFTNAYPGKYFLKSNYYNLQKGQLCSFTGTYADIPLYQLIDIGYVVYYPVDPNIQLTEKH